MLGKEEIQQIGLCVLHNLTSVDWITSEEIWLANVYTETQVVKVNERNSDNLLLTVAPTHLLIKYKHNSIHHNPEYSTMLSLVLDTCHTDSSINVVPCPAVHIAE